MALSGPIGRLLAPWNVEQAVISTLVAWLPLYLYEIERQNNLAVKTLQRPPAPESVIGGLDFEYWQQDLLPMLIVATVPVETPDLERAVGYSQTYGVDVACVIASDDEDDGRRDAGLYAAAVAGIILQRGGLGGLATRTRMVRSPMVVLPDPEVRQITRGETGFHVTVDGIASDTAGPVDPTPPADPSIPPLPWPTASVKGITITARPVSS